MAGNGTTTFARVRSTYLERQLERERSAVDICKYRFASLLVDMQRALACEVRDDARIAEIALDIVDAETALSMARMDLEEAEDA